MGVEVLLQNGADVNAKTKDGSTALMMAAGYGQKDIVKLLLQNNANINVKNKYGTTALMSAAHEGYNDSVEILLQNNADVNLRSNYGHSALYFAVGQSVILGQEGKAIIELLLQNNTDFGFWDYFFLGWEGIYYKIIDVIPSRFMKMF